MAQLKDELNSQLKRLYEEHSILLKEYQVRKSDVKYKFGETHSYTVRVGLKYGNMSARNNRPEQIAKVNRYMYDLRTDILYMRDKLANKIGPAEEKKKADEPIIQYTLLIKYITASEYTEMTDDEKKEQKLLRKEAKDKKK